MGNHNLKSGPRQLFHDPIDHLVKHRICYMVRAAGELLYGIGTVSYTHLDVYKRQTTRWVT